jgi:hypothetical protein
MQVLPCGSKVYVGDTTTGNNGSRGVITEILIQDKNISYKVAWWNGGSRVCEFLTEGEIRVKEVKEVTIGFIPKEKT